MKDFFQKFGKRTIAVPGAAMMLTLVNDAQKMGLAEHLLIFAVKCALIWAAYETVKDCVRMICDAFGKRPISPGAQPVTKTPPAPAPTSIAPSS